MVMGMVMVMVMVMVMIVTMIIMIMIMILTTRACILQGDGLGPTDPTFGKHLSTLYELRG